MTSVALSVLVMCQLFVLFHCRVCVAMVWTHMVSFGGLFHFLFIIACFIFSVFSRSSSGDVKGLLGTFSRCDHINRVQVKGHGGVSSTFKSKPGFRPQVGPLVGWFIAHTRIHTAGKLGLDVTSVLGAHYNYHTSSRRWQTLTLPHALLHINFLCHFS